MLQRVWGWRCGLLQVLVVLSSAVAADSLYRLVPPDVYVVFGGDLEVVFHMPGNVSLPNAFVRLQGHRPRDDAWIEITTMGLPLSRKSGTLSAACGIVEFAGRYSLTMFMQVDGPVLTEVTFLAVWPSVILRLPQTHYALTSSVILVIDSRATCASRLHREVLTLELYFQRMENNDSDYARLSDSVKIAADNITSLDKEQQKWEYNCGVFDLDGSYQVLLRSSSGTTLTVSNVMDVTFSAGYHLSSRSPSIFPCVKDSTFNVLYTRPSCSGVDKFRVYKLRKKAPGSMASPLEKVYVTELDVNPDRSRFGFNCSLFEESAMGYCFVYVTVSRSGAVMEQKQFCVPSQPDAALPQDGGWSTWTSWTTCSVTCGTGKRNRFRMCNNPSPDHGGRYCGGQAVQWSHCQVSCPDALPRTPLRFPTFDPTCYCGCTRSTSESAQIIASGRCAGLATWIIKAVPGQQVTLTFRYYHISYDRQWVKVRDGDSESDDLLFYSRAQSQPDDVTSSSNVMRVELMTEVIMRSPAELSTFAKNATLPIHVHGFIASYKGTVQDPAAVPPPLYRHVETTVMESGVTIVGIVVCSIVVVALVVFAVVQRKYWGRLPKYSAANEESPAHVVHSSSAQSSQPSSPGPQVQVDMDIPLTGGSGARRKSSSGQRAASRASSISSTCSAGIKKIRSRAENVGAGGEGGAGVVCNGSPKPSTKDYSNLNSPYSNNASPEDAVHDANFFRASPILRQVAPRSPKVHPHKLKASPGTPASPGPSPSITKHEMLTRKRQERKGMPASNGEVDGEREVTGSSGSCSTATKPTATAGTITTTKAEINLAKPPEVKMLNSARKMKSPLEPKMWTCAPKLRPPPDSKVQNSDAKLRSPTDSNAVGSAVGAGKRHSQGDKSPRQEEIPLMDSVEDLQPHLLPAEPTRTPLCEETSFIYPKTKARRPTSLTNSYTSDSAESRGSKSRTPRSPPSANGKPSAMEERQTLLPKPDGQSPKSPREEALGVEREEKGSKGSSSPSKSSLGGKSNKTLSPSRSIATPELEYDDFIMDDPLSYFEYEELGRLNWTGTEKLGRSGKGGNK